MDVRCEQALERLWPLTEPGGIDSPELAAARDHLQRCSDCQAFFRRDATLGRRLRDLRSARTIELPEACRAALRMQLMGNADATDSDSGSDPDVKSIRSIRNQRWRAWSAAAAAIALLVGGLVISRSIEAPLSDGVFTADFMLAGLPAIEAPLSDGVFTADFMLAGLPAIESGDLSPTQVMAFYAEQFGDRMDPARMLDARVTRVAVCVVGGRRGAMVEYELGGERLVYYQIPVGNGQAASDLRTGREDGLNVARWGDDRSEHVLVSALPIENLEEYAQQRID